MSVELVTTRPDGTSPYYLGQIGPVDSVSWTDTMPGGPAALTATLDADPATRHEAINPGRRILAYRGLTVAWEGRLQEPVPGDAGWALTADGIGLFGNYYRADYTTWTATNIVTRAAARGLRWTPGNLSGGNLGQPPDTSSQSVTDALNAIAAPASSTWRISRAAGGWQADLIPIPTQVTRMLYTTVPQARTIAGYVNALTVRYQVSADKGTTPAAYATTTPTLPDSIGRHDRTEDYWDISSAGVMTSGAAAALGQQALAKYAAASWSGPFTASAGQYLSAGGVPVDLALEHAGQVAQLILADGPYGGEVYPTPPITFPVGATKYDAAADTLEITPFQNWRNDLGAVLTLIAPKAPA